MGYNPEPIIKIWEEQNLKLIKSELKANRKKDGEWMRIPHHGLPGQCNAQRFISPRGIQSRWNHGDITTIIPECKNGKYQWRAVP